MSQRFLIVEIRLNFPLFVQLEKNLFMTSVIVLRTGLIDNIIISFDNPHEN